jgi:AcrR family transcriptional regulator
VSVGNGKGDNAVIKGTPELIADRREVIINACEKLYQTMSFKEITLKEIGMEVPFSRPTIYNYFQTREEIFLALYEREYNRWNESLRELLDQTGSMSEKKLASAIANTLTERMQLLKLLAMNNYDMEANSRPELLVTFKRAYGESMNLMRKLLKKYCPAMKQSEIDHFIYTFFPFMFGIYPYTEVSEKQNAAMKEAGIQFKYQSVYELTYNCLINLLEKR